MPPPPWVSRKLVLVDGQGLTLAASLVEFVKSCLPLLGYPLEDILQRVCQHDNPSAGIPYRPPKWVHEATRRQCDDPILAPRPAQEIL